MAPPQLATARLTLRAFTPDDAPAVFEACSNPVLGTNAGWPPHQTIQDSLDYINIIAPMGHVWAICKAGEDKVVGSIGLLADPRTPEDATTMLLGYWLAEPCWNQGYMTEAAQAVIAWGFDEAHLQTITTSHFPFNRGSRRVIEKCGFRKTEFGLWPSDDPDEPDQDVQWYQLSRPQSATE